MFSVCFYIKLYFSLFIYISATLYFHVIIQIVKLLEHDVIGAFAIGLRLWRRECPTPSHLPKLFLFLIFQAEILQLSLALYFICD
jgi:hypothetical protein